MILEVVNFWDYKIWELLIQLTVLMLGMLYAHMLIRLIKPLRHALIPSSVLGGFILLAFNVIVKRATGTPFFDQTVLESLTFHCLGLGFVAMALKTNVKKSGKKEKREIFDSGITVVSSYLMQAIIGLAITITLGYTLFPNLFKAGGILLALGYGQGPGQALNFGKTYEDTYGFVSGGSFGLTIASMGFIAASIGGVIYLNILKKKGRIIIQDDFISENLSAIEVSSENEIPMTESMDKLTVQIGLVMFSYFLAFLAMFGISTLMDTNILGNFGTKTIKPLIWGFNFLIGTIFAIIVKVVLNKLKDKQIINREYRNNFMLSRIGGFLFDVMVVASIAAIQIEFLEHYILPMVLICVIGGVATYFQIAFITKRIFPDYPDEAFLSLYGNLTGTASTGIILLRELDTEFETPAATNLVYLTLPAIVFGFPMMLLLGYAPQNDTATVITLFILIVLFIAMNLILFRRSIFKKNKKEEVIEKVNEE
ncbi:MAG: hypothetical protein ACOX4W_03785 [Bacilli bacterium]|jgi:ESS family glutamate:Na+ symporter